MGPWRVRLALRRSRLQWALLSVVLLVSVLASTLLATLYLLSDATETFAARSALTEAPAADTRMVVLMEPRAEIEGAIEGADAAAAATFQDVPYSRAVHVEGARLEIPREDARIALSYLASYDGVEDHAALVQGAWPASDALEVAVPVQLAEDQSLEVGDRFTLGTVFSVSDQTEALVTGIYQARDTSADFWRLDLLSGTGYNPQMPVPLSGGRILTDGYGPLIVDFSAVQTFAVDRIDITYLPDFSQTSLAQVESLMARLPDTETLAIGQIGASATNVRVATTVDTTLGSVVGSLAVTRSSVLVTGLLLLVLSIAALGQTARLMSERRHIEQSLMIARGASGRQLLHVAAIEAIVLGALTAAAGPFLATYAYRAVASQDAMARAGMNQDPGMPPLLWAVSGFVGLVLVAVLVAPLLRRSASFLDAEQARARPGKRAAFQRSGIDIALVALAGLAYWQLQSYESPVVTGDGVARLDPLLAAGPALVLLAGALLAVRLIPAASKVLEWIAARGKRAVMPLAAWEIGRRSARAVSAILLLTLAVSIGTFALSYLATWRVSQEDQAQLHHPMDAVVSDLQSPDLAQSAEVTVRGIDSQASPSMARDAVFTTQLEDGLDEGAARLSGRDVTLMASDPAGLEFFAQGRAGEEGGSVIPAALQADGDSGNDRPALTLPGRPSALQLDVSMETSTTVLTGIQMSLRLVLEDANGLLSTVDFGTVPVTEEPLRLTADVVDPAYTDALATPLRIVGTQATWLALPTDDVDASELAGESPLEIIVAIDDIMALEVGTVVPVAGQPPVYDKTPLEGSLTEPWYASNDGAGPLELVSADHDLFFHVRTGASALRFRPASINLTAAPVQETFPIVASAGLASRASAQVGQDVRLQVDDTVVTATVSDIAALVPSDQPRQDAVIAATSDVQWAVVQQGGAAPALDEWWIHVADEDVPAYTDAVSESASVTSRVAETESLQENPLRVATQAALWLVTGAAVVLAAFGFAVHAVVTVRARTIEFAQLRAVGISRGQLLRIVSGESLLVSILGVAFGVGLGVALGYLVGPLVSVGADGRAPLPAVLVEIPWTTIGLLAVEMAAVLLVTVALVGLMLRRIDPASMLRMGENQ